MRNHQPGTEADLIEAEKLVDELARRQPDLLGTVVLQVDVYKARKQLYKALEVIEQSARRPKLTPKLLKTLATLAEQLDRLDTADRLFRQYAELPQIPDGTTTLAQFLGRQGRVNEALNLLAPLWGEGGDPDAVATASFRVIAAGDKPVDDAQFERVAGWLDQAIKQNGNSVHLVFTLADLRTNETRLTMRKHFTGNPSTGSLRARYRHPIRAGCLPWPTIIWPGSRRSKTARERTLWWISTARSSLSVPGPTCSTHEASFI